MEVTPENELKSPELKPVKISDSKADTNIAQKNEDPFVQEANTTMEQPDVLVKESMESFGEVKAEKHIDEAEAYVTNLIDKAAEIAVQVHDNIEQKGFAEYAKELSYKGINTIAEGMSKFQTFLNDSERPIKQEDLIRDSTREENQLQ